jgi:hypothetical protein
MRLEPSIARDETRDAIAWYFGIRTEEEISEKLLRLSSAKLDEIMNLYYDEMDNG